MSKKKSATIKEPKRIFVLEVFDQHSQTRAIESNIVQRAAQLAMQDFRSGVGLKSEGQIKDGFDQVLGRWRYEPAATAA
jgi:hypothetical protein